MGALQEGAPADWIVLAAQSPNLAQHTPQTWLSSVVFCEHGETPVCDMYVSREQGVAQRRRRDETRLHFGGADSAALRVFGLPRSARRFSTGKYSVVRATIALPIVVFSSDAASGGR